MSSVGSPRPFAHRQFGFVNPHALGAGRLSPLSHDSLVAMSCSLINFSSEAAAAAAACLPPGRVCLGCGLARVPALLNFLLKNR